MINIFTGTYQQVEESISESFMQNRINTLKQFRTFKMLIFLVFFIGLLYAIYGGSIYIGNHMEEAEITLDLNNEYIPFLSSIWYVNLAALFFLLAAVTGRYYSGKHNIKGFYLYNIFQMLGFFMFMLLFFKFSQLVILTFAVRVLYAVIFIAVLLFILVKSYQRAVKMVYGTEKKRHPLVEWMSRKSKVLYAILVPIGSLVYFIKTVSDSAGDLETKMVGSLLGVLPLICSAVLFVFLYFSGVMIRSYYLNKYSEEFRQKFGVEKEVWYGLKPFPLGDEDQVKQKSL